MDSFFKKMFSMPAVKADEEELVDPLVTAREECQPHCTQFREKYEKCNQRVRSKKNTAETCVEELTDFLHCLDHCAAPKIFAKLK